MEESKENITKDDYFKLWKLDYEFIHGQRIYDFVNDTFLEDAHYMTEDEYYKKLNEE
jgi:hypothetical protein